MTSESSSEFDTVLLSRRESLCLKLTTTIHSDNETEWVLSQWRELEIRLGNRAVACSADWTEAWLKFFGRTVRYHFVVATADDRIRGIALVVQSKNLRRGPFQVKSVHLGTAGENDRESVCVEYNRLLVEEDYRPTFEDIVLKHIQQELDYDELSFDGFDASYLNHVFETLDTSTLRIEESRYFDLKAARESNGDVISNLGKSTRANIRRRLREIQKEHGEINVNWASDLSDADDIFAELVELHQARWESVGQLGAFASDRFRDFQHELAARLLPENRLVLARLAAGQKTIGCLLLLVDNNRLLDYVSGLADFQSIPSPGLISHYLCMEEALHRGFDAYDFLIGEKRHKENLGKSVNQLVWASVKRPTLKNVAISSLRSMKKAFQK